MSEGIKRIKARIEIKWEEKEDRNGKDMKRKAKDKKRKKKEE